MGSQKLPMLPLVVWIIVSTWCCHIGSCTLSPDVQAKISTGLSTANAILKEGKDHYDNRLKSIRDIKVLPDSDRLNKLGRLDRLDKITRYMKYTRAIGVVMKFASVASTAFSFISTFFMPSQLEVISDVLRAEFERVNEKLDAISNQISQAREEIKSVKSSVEFNNWITTYITWEFAIRNGDIKLKSIIGNMKTSGSVKDRLKLASEFIKYIERENIEGAIENIYRLTGLPMTATTKNLFYLFVKENGCCVTELTKLMDIIKDIVASGTQQVMTYYAFKDRDLDRGRKYSSKMYGYLYNIRRQFDIRVWECMRNGKHHAYTEITRLNRDYRSASAVDMSIAISRRLHYCFPWYTWSTAIGNVVQKGQISCKINWGWSRTVKQFTFDHITYRNFNIPSKGKSLRVPYTVQGQRKGEIIVLRQPIRQLSPNCNFNNDDAKSLIFFTLCESCREDVFRSGFNVPTSKACLAKHGSDYTRTFIAVQLPEGVTSSCSFQYNTHFIATSIKRTINPCDFSDTCNGHGICTQIPETSSFLCICDAFFDGDQCEIYTNHEASERISDMIASLRANNVIVSGVPTVIDVYFQVEEMTQIINRGFQELQLTKRLLDLRNGLTDSIRYNRMLTMYANELKDANYIAGIYSDYRKCNIGDKVFLEQLKKRMSMPYLLHSLEWAILGKNPFLGTDILTSFKRALVSENGAKSFACQQSYSVQVENVRKALRATYHLLCEALLAKYEIKFKLEPDNGRELLDFAEKVYNETKSRPRLFESFWKNSSCPALNKSFFSCTDQDSYDGLEVNTCPKNVPVKLRVLPIIDKKRGFFHALAAVISRIAANVTGLKNFEGIWTPYPSSAVCGKHGSVLQWTANIECRLEWTPWTAWSQCSKTCRREKSLRTRAKNGEIVGENKPCNKDDCGQDK